MEVRGSIRHRRLPLLAVVAAAWALASAGCGSSGSGHTASSPSNAANVSTPTSTASGTSATESVTGSPVRVVDTADGAVGYREVGSGAPLVLIMGLGGTMQDWAPTFVDSLAENHRVVIFDNAGIGQTAPLPSPLTITAMADQTSALISTLGLGRPDVLGWSMGGMIAQALAIQHPGQVSHLVLAATQPGTGRSVPIPAAAAAGSVSSSPAAVLSVLFPPDQAAAEQAYVAGILQYGSVYAPTTAVKDAQVEAIGRWFEGADPSGPRTPRITSPTLVADGTQDALDPVANDRILASTIPGARLVLYAGAGHAFLFQDSAQFLPVLEQFLG